MIDAPTADMMSATDVARLFGVSEDTLTRLVSSGEFPAPLRIGKTTKLYDWRSVAFYRLKLELQDRLSSSASGKDA